MTGRFKDYGGLRKYVEFKGFKSFSVYDNIYFIDINGAIKNKNGDIISPFLSAQGELLINLTFLDGREIPPVRVAVLIAANARNINLDFNFYRQLNVYYLDGNPLNIHPSNTIWKPFPSGIACGPTRYIPGHTRYGITRTGQIFNLKTGKELKWKKNIFGYIWVEIISDVGRHGIPQHRALMLAWSDYPSNVYELHVNHKNGIKADNDLDNLEWCTAKENLRHAYDTGLHLGPGTDKSVSVKDTLSQKEMSFKSIRSASRFYNISASTIADRCESMGTILYQDNLQFRYGSITGPWELNPVRLEYRIGVKTKNISTGKIQSFDSLHEASEFYKLPRSTITNWCKSDGEIIYAGYLWKYVNSTTSWCKNPISGGNEVGVCIRNVATNEIITYNNLAEAATEFKISYQAVVYRCKTDGNVVYNGFQWKYKQSNSDWGNIPKRPYQRNQYFLQHENNPPIKFKTQREISIYLNTTQQTISKLLADSKHHTRLNYRVWKE